MTTHTAAAGPGLPIFTLPALPANADAYQLWALHSAVITLADGLLCQPRFTLDSGMLLNDAGEALAAIQEYLCRYSTALYEQAKTLPPGDGSRDDYRARLLIEDGAACFDGIEIFIPSVLEAAQGKEARS